MYLTKISQENRLQSYYQCVCGKTKLFYDSNVRSGKSKSCGCKKRELLREANGTDLSGQIFEFLTVISRDESRPPGKWGAVYWTCRCQCGNTITASTRHLIQGFYKSCGCRRQKLRFKEKGKSGFNKLIKSYRRHAKERGYSFDLTEEQFMEITQNNCYYCGDLPSKTSIGLSIRKGTTEESKSHGAYIYNGIDRVDNTLGYSIDNCVACCCYCNWAKRDLTIEEFKKTIEKIASHLSKKTLPQRL